MVLYLPALLLLLMTGSAVAQCDVDSIKTDCGNTSFFFEHQHYDTIAPFALIHVHENEATALQAAEWLLDSLKQGSLTTWRGQRQRLIEFSLGSGTFHFDPNRIYTYKGIRATVGYEATDSVIAALQTVADAFVNHFILGKKLVVALHNNTNNAGLSVKSYSRSGVYAQDAQAVFINPRQDADDFFYTTEVSFFEALKKKGFNIVLQHNKQVTDDGSLSVFCARHGIPYINIEVEYGHLLQQKRMLQALWRYIEQTD